jgi:nucleoid DNA-binding protein
LVGLIYDRLGHAIPRDTISVAVSIICDDVAQMLVDDIPVTAKHFGTLSPYVYHGHRARDVNTGKVIETKPFRTVKFHPHESFFRLIEEQRERFLGQ